MSDSMELLRDRFSELLLRARIKGIGKDTFTILERKIYFLLLMACENDMNGFASIFEQALSLDEINESIIYMKELGLVNIAKHFEEALNLIHSESAYGTTGLPIKRFSEELSEKLREIGDIIDDTLWHIDEHLAEILRQENELKGVK